MKLNLDSTYDKCLDLTGARPVITFVESNYYVWAKFGYLFDGQIFFQKGRTDDGRDK